MVQNTFSASLRKLLTAPCSGVLIAVSGGVDSMVMTHLFIQWMAGGEGVGLCQRIAMAHMDFCLRGEESEGDQAFVADFARRTGSFYTKKVNTRTYAAERGFHGNGGQELLRLVQTCAGNTVCRISPPTMP